MILPVVIYTNFIQKATEFIGYTYFIYKNGNVIKIDSYCYDIPDKWVIYGNSDFKQGSVVINKISEPELYALLSPIDDDFDIDSKMVSTKKTSAGFFIYNKSNIYPFKELVNIMPMKKLGIIIMSPSIDSLEELSSHSWSSSCI